ncbi:MAG: alginate lyase family protein [Draconibacterium sp.]|nr:alginate lyase family protein [Draconibacterium sp.]
MMILFSCNKDQADFQPDSFGEVIYENPKKYEELFTHLDLDIVGLEGVKEEYEKGNKELALEFLFDYYKNNNAGKTLRETEVVPININKPILDYLKDTYTYFGVSVKIPRKSNGSLDWKYVPPESTQEFTHYLNRFIGLSHWIRAAVQTQNEIWIDFLNDMLVDFVESNPYRSDRLAQPLEEECRSYEFGGKNNYPWLILNAGVRLREFQKAFYLMLEHNLMKPETFLLLLSSIEEHTDYLYTRGGFNGDNWDNINLSSLLKTGMYFPEFKRNVLFRDEAAERYFNNLRKVWYPDGSQWELAPHYGFVVLNNCFAFIDLLDKAEMEIPVDIQENLTEQVLYNSVITNPDGMLLPLNDSDPVEDISEKLLEFAKRIENENAVYILSNGTQGTAPVNPPARMFGYSGNLISRNSWENPTQFSCFDVGPFGVGHNHADKLSLTIYNKRRILVDPGRFVYGSANQWREYATSTRAHNTISVDGANQKMLSNNGAAGLPGAVDDYLRNNSRSFLQQYDMARDNPIPLSDYGITETYDYAQGAVFAGYEGNSFSGEAIHQRAVHYERGKFWLVVDKITSDREREIQTFWHFHPDCNLEKNNENHQVFSNDTNEGNLLICPAESNTFHSFEVIEGEEGYTVQGWYSSEYGSWEPASVARYSSQIEKEATMAWLFVPFDGSLAPQASLKIIKDSEQELELEVQIESEIKKLVISLAEQKTF